MHLVTACDPAYVPGVAALLGSLDLAREEDSDPVSVTLLAAGLPRADRDRLERVADALGIPLEVRRVAPAPAAGTGRYGAPILYARFAIPSLLAADRALYVDADLVFVRCPTALVREAPAGTAPIHAVQDLCMPYFGAPGGLAGHDADGLRGRRYFNSGLMLLELGVWRAEGLAARARALASGAEPALPYPDQDALNILTSARWRPLDPRWNVFPITEMLALWGVDDLGEHAPRAQLDRLEHEAWAIHFVTEVKPWVKGFPRGPNRERWWRAYDHATRAAALTCAVD